MQQTNKVQKNRQSILNKARKDKFWLVLNLPQILLSTDTSSDIKSNDLISLNKLQFSVWGVPVPAVQVPAKQVSYSGQTTNITSYTRPTYTNLNIRFTVDNEYSNYWVMWSWLNLLNDRRRGFYNQRGLLDSTKVIQTYKSNISLYGLDEFRRPIIKFDYIGAFPVGLSSIEYSDRDEDELESSCEFVFDQMDVKRLNESERMTIKPLPDIEGFDYNLDIQF